MKPWLEDLSEEWIPQPAPQSTENDANSLDGTQTTQSVPPKPRSMLPRMRHSSGSFSEIQVRHNAKDIRPPKTRSALAERSLSDNNIPPTASSDALDTAPSRYASQSFSASSNGSVIHAGTVAHKPAVPSPQKDQPIQNTPEWKKRLLKGEVAYGEQKDLFSPMGLENIFQRPSSGHAEEPKQRKSKLGLLKGLSAIPSSPPPWPTQEQGKDNDDQEEQENTYESSHNAEVEEGLHAESELPSMETRGFGNSQAAPRTVSGQIEFENENFSPVYLSTNLKIGTTPQLIPDFNGSDLAHRLRHLGTPQPTITRDPASDGDSIAQSRSQSDSSFAKLQDDTLPEDLPAGTPDLADVGRFVEMKRGGYSREGSFRRRPLSPSPQSKGVKRSGLEVDTTTANSTEAETEGDYSSGTVNVQRRAHSPARSPVTPRRREQATLLSPERAHASGSPLKLFDAHDTFTSNRLQRRLSQLEHKSDKTSTIESKTEVTKLVQKTSRLTSVEEVSMQQVTSGSVNAHPPETRQLEPRRVETFGRGQLDQYSFPEDFSVVSSQESYGQESAPDGSPSIDVAPPGSRQPFRFQLDSSPEPLKSSRAQRQGLTRVSNPFRRATNSRSHASRMVSAMKTQEEASQPEYAEGKRGPTSPFKNPTPKRRRTLHLGETDDEDVFSDGGLTSVKGSHIAMQSIIGRKRKDARHDHSMNVADPETLARRHILRPRNPTPNQSRRDDIHAEIIEATEAFILSSPKMNTIREQLDPPSDASGPSEESRAAAVANEVAAFNLKRVQVARDESRKKSVTTQDFLDEAVKIMDYIRAKGRPTSGLGSLEETDSESPIHRDESHFPSPSLTFSRPPSREGRLSAWREPNKRTLDPNVVSHLRKFQEKESDDFMGSSIRSLRFSRLRGPNSPDGHSVVVEQDNIRIIDNLDRHQEPLDEEHGIDSQPRTNGTNPSTGSSMGQTVATSASRRSEHVATLAPDAVAHLIPEQIAGMSFDREKNIWVRNKSPSKEIRPTEDISSANESEEDPFGNIPDLTVDETAEIIRKQGSPTRPQATAETILEETGEVEREDHARPVTREGKGIAFPDTSSVPSKVSNNFAWSFPKTETRATSYSDQETRNGGTQKIQPLQTTYTIPESDEIDFEHEIKYYEGRGAATPVMGKARVRDITFSIKRRDFGDQDEEQRDASSPQRRSEQQWGYSKTHQSSRTQKSTWRQVPGAKTLPSSRKPIIPEEAELSILEDLPSRNYRMQLSMSVAAPPMSTQKQDALVAPSSPVKGDVTFMLSDLPEFTLHQVDECELPDRVVVKHDGTRFSKALEDRYAQGTADLIKALQDVAPEEPYWEDLREVNLHKKGLSNLHRLDEFCYRLEELDMSNNDINQVKGIPYTMRRLHAQNNCLTGLTSWASLMNLQHLDISGNEIDSLDGLSDLIHLRTLKVDNNQVKSLDGIMHLDALMELSVGGNQIEAVDFSHAELYVSLTHFLVHIGSTNPRCRKSLKDLNLRGNRLVDVRGLHCLPQLQHLDLGKSTICLTDWCMLIKIDDNSIEEFPIVDIQSGRCKALRSLRLCRNGMASLEIDFYCPRLESLYVDGNSLGQVVGLENLRHLRTFSAREQMLETDSDTETCVGNLVQNPDIRNLYISVNPTRCLDISQHLLNLQRLELASMGLKELPDNFGQLTPNIRSINLNFNSLKDLRPLLNIKRLTELLIAGNKLTRLRTNLAVLSKLTTLTKVDMRENPITLRFYPPASENRVMSLRRKPTNDDVSETDRFVLPDGDPEEDKQYQQRLDFETRLRRRVQEIMLSTQCRSLSELDGLPFDKARILVKDDIWERLSYLGVIRRTETSEGNTT
jgi:Leucine-rich repeat (LRR) protein